ASVIAERSGLTRQAITMIVDELEAAGVVRRAPDPEDGRAKRIGYTEAALRGEPEPEDGRATPIVYTDAALPAFDEGRVLIADIERRWKRRLGKERWGGVKGALREMAYAIGAHR